MGRSVKKKPIEPRVIPSIEMCPPTPESCCDQQATTSNGAPSTGPRDAHETHTHPRAPRGMEPARERSRERRARPEVEGPAECKRARRLSPGSRAEVDGGDGDVLSRDVKSQHRGVSWNKAVKKWEARKMVQGKQVYLGLYADEEDAARAIAEYVERGVVDPPGRGGVTSDHTGVSWNIKAKKWVAKKRVQGKLVHLGLYADEEDAARAVAEYVERGIVDPPGRGGGTSEHTCVSWNKAKKKWVAQKWVQGKNVHLGYYADEEDAARAVVEYVERGVVDPPGRGGVTSEHMGVSWNKARKKWLAQKWDKGKKVHLGLYAAEEDAARAVTEYVERGVVPRSGRGYVTSEHMGVCWNKAAKKWLAQKWDKGKLVHLGHYTDEEDAARAVAEYVERGAVPPQRRGGLTSEHRGVSWNKAKKKWEAQKWDKGKQVHLGHYTDEEDAARAVAAYVERGVVATQKRGGGTSEQTGVSWNKAAKKWRAHKRVQGKQVHLGYYADEEDAARAVAEYVERGVVPTQRRGGVTSEHTGVSWNVASKKWVAQKMVQGKQVHLGYYADEEDAARAVAEYVERGVVPRSGRGGVTSAHR